MKNDVKMIQGELLNGDLKGEICLQASSLTFFFSNAMTENPNRGAIRFTARFIQRTKLLPKIYGAS